MKDLLRISLYIPFIFASVSLSAQTGTQSSSQSTQGSSQSTQGSSQSSQGSPAGAVSVPGVGSISESTLQSMGFSDDEINSIMGSVGAPAEPASTNAME